MKKLLALVTAAAIAATMPALADSPKPSTDQNTNVNTVVAAPVATATGGQGGQGGKGGTGVGIGIGYGEGGNATIERGAVKVDNDNTNVNLQGQAQKQKQSQSQSQTAKSSSRSSSSSYSGVKESGNSNVEINDIDRRQTPPAYAPAPIIGSEVCGQSQSAGGSSPVFGFSIGITHDNDGCNLRRNATILNALGQKGAAVELLCRDDDVREAMKAAGTPCAADRPAPQPVAALEPMATEDAVKVAKMEPIPN